MAETKTTTRLIKKSEYNDTNCVIHEIFGEESESFAEYDENGNVLLYKLISKRDNTVNTWTYEYNKNNKLIHTINTRDIIDEKRNQIHSYLNGVIEHWREFDEKDQLISIKCNDKGILSEVWFSYEEDGEYIGSIDSDGKEYPNYNKVPWPIDGEDEGSTITETDDHGNTIYSKDSYDEFWQEFDENDNLIHYKDAEGRESLNEYDKEGRMIRSKLNYLEETDDILEEFYEITYEYDNSDNIIHQTDSLGYEFRQFYNEHNMISRVEYILPKREDIVYTYDDRGNTLEINRITYEEVTDNVNTTSVEGISYYEQ